MKKMISTCLACTCLIIASFGQVDIGVKFGLNFAKVNNLNGYNTSNRLGFNTGITTRIKIAKQFKLQPELLYSAKGFEYSATPWTSAGSTRLNYLSLPLLGALSVGKGFSLLFGPEFDMLLHANAEYDKTDHNVSKDFHHFGVGFDVGVSYHIIGGLGVEARYNYGVSQLNSIHIYDSTFTPIGNNSSGRSQVIQVGVYFYFPK